jgi:hypothetical protein
MGAGADRPAWGGRLPTFVPAGEENVAAEVVGPEPPVGPSWPVRIWLGLLGGTGYRVLAQHRRGAYTAFLVVATCAAIALAGISAAAVSHTLRALLAAWSELPAFTVTQHGLVLPPGVRPPVQATRAGATVVLAAAVPNLSNPLGTATVGMVVSPQQLILRPAPGDDVALPMQAVGPLPLSKAELEGKLAELAGPGLWLIAILSVLIQVGRDFVRAAIIAWVGLTVARFGGRSPTWPEAWRIGMAAWTLPMLAEVARLWVPYSAFWLWFVAGVYAVIGCYSLGATDRPGASS